MIQFIKYDDVGDHVLLTLTTRELIKLGYKGSRSNTPASYLLGLLAGKKAQEKEISSGIFDIGMYNPINKSKLFAALKGLVDSGFEVPHSEEAFPSEDRISGKHISKYIKEAKGVQFGKYKKENLTPEQFEKNIQEVKKKILGK